MIKVDVIFPAYINATIGPCGTLRRLNKHKDYIQNRGYELSIFTLDSALTQTEGLSVDFSRGLTFRSKVKSFLGKTTLGVMIMHYKTHRQAQKVLDYYNKQNRNADIVVFHEIGSCGQYTKYRKDGQKVVCFFHSDGTRWGMTINAHPWLKDSWWLAHLDKQINKTLRQIDHYVFITKIGQENFLKENPFVLPEKTSFFHNGIENMPILVKEKYNKFKYNICSVGTISHRKGQYLIIEALHSISKKVLKDIHLTLYGTGPDFEYVKKLIQQYDLENHVFLNGNLSNSIIHETLCRHNIFILMSNNEGLPISIIEAMRAGLPIISTKVSGIPEEVDKRNGILINPDAQELTKILEQINCFDWTYMGQQSRIRFENEFSFKKMMECYCNMLDKTTEL